MVPEDEEVLCLLHFQTDMEKREQYYHPEVRAPSMTSGNLSHHRDRGRAATSPQGPSKLWIVYP